MEDKEIKEENDFINEDAKILELVNSKIKSTKLKNDKTGKEIGDYVEVNQRVRAFRMIYPKGAIRTEIISCQNGVCVMKASIYTDDGIILATGLANEKENSTFINKTSYIENCETSAIGRALGFAGFGIDSAIASKEEVINAVVNQENDMQDKLDKLTIEDAKKIVIDFGKKHNGETLEEVYEYDENYLNWIINNSRNEYLVKACCLITGFEYTDKDDTNKKIKLMSEFKNVVEDTNSSYEKILNHYQVNSDMEMTIDQLTDAINKMKGN